MCDVVKFSGISYADKSFEMQVLSRGRFVALVDSAFQQFLNTLTPPRTSHHPHKSSRSNFKTIAALVGVFSYNARRKSRNGYLQA